MAELKAILVVLAAVLGLSQQTAVTLSVYYESLCPDSIRFVNRQLYPTWQKLGEEFMKVDFVPYGKARHSQLSDGNWTFSCQHGKAECKGNMLQACALKSFSGDQTLSNKFVHCAMSSSYPPTAGQECATEVGVDYEPIKKCQETIEGAELLAAYGDRTHTEFPNIGFVPTVAFNGEYSSTDQDNALDDLLEVVCLKISGTKPEACSGLAASFGLVGQPGVKGRYPRPQRK